MLWLREHYQFFPLLVPGVLVLAWQRLPGCGSLSPGPRPVCYALLGLSWILLAGGLLLNSPWLGAVATLLLLAGIIIGLGGWTLALALLPAWTLLWLAVPLPDQLDARLVLSLQRVTAVCASRVLDLLGVYHYRDGNLIEVGDRRLEVEATCSGVQSLFSILACTLFWLFWNRRPFLHGVALLALSLLWVLGGNVTRIVVVACFDGIAGVKLSEGWGHDALGFILFGVTLGLVWSTEQLLLPLTVLLQIRWRRPPVEEEQFPLGKDPLAQGPAPTRLPSFGTTALAAWPVLAAFSALALLQLGSFSWGGMAGTVDLPDDVDRRLEALGEADLPPYFRTWERTKFEVVRRQRGDSLGQNSRVWHYRRESRSADASLDYPFVGWHKIEECYQGQGWTVEDEQVHEPDAASGGKGPFLTMRLHKPLEEEYAYLVFQMRYAAGDPVPPLAERLWGRILGRLQAARPVRLLMERGSTASAPDSPSYQFQWLVLSHMPLSPGEENEAQKMFHKLLNHLPISPSQPQEQQP
jgi:exosortase